MKKDYRINNSTDIDNKFIYVFNFEPLNDISNYGFYEKPHEISLSYCIGVWNVKHKTT